MSQRR
jgi:hypothetical protein